MECLYVNFDFDSAQKKLRECESVSTHFSHLTNSKFIILLPNGEEMLFWFFVHLRDNMGVFWGRLICGSDPWTFTQSIIVLMVSNRVICVWPSARSHSDSFRHSSAWVQWGRAVIGWALYLTVWYVEVSLDTVWLRLQSDYAMSCNWPISLVVNNKSFISTSLRRGVQTLCLRGRSVITPLFRAFISISVCNDEM